MGLESKIRTGQYLVDKDLNQLTFLDVRFYPDDNGGYQPSVSTVLDAYPKGEFFYKWLKENGEDADAIRDEAGETGSIVHGLCERYDEGDEVSVIDETGRIKYKAKEWNMFEKYVSWCDAFNPEILENERSMCSKNLGFGGTLDKRIILDGQKVILDLKTSNMIHDTYWMQLAAYKKMYEELTGDIMDNIAILWLNAKTRTEKYKAGEIYQLKGVQLLFPPKDIEHYWKLFLHCQALWTEVNGDLKPRDLTYSLTHKK